MCLTNATLPSKSLGGSNCSLKYKKAPQDAFLATWQPALDAWSRGQRVRRLIGYDAGPRDTLRANHALSIDDPLYECEYPLREWGWDRDACTARIVAEGLPVPPKSACWLCIANQPQEIRDLPRWCLRLIVLVEARAAPRLHTVEGLRRAAPGARGRSHLEHGTDRPDPLPGRCRLDPDRGAPDDAGLDRPFDAGVAAAERPLLAA